MKLTCAMRAFCVLVPATTVVGCVPAPNSAPASAAPSSSSDPKLSPFEKHAGGAFDRGSAAEALGKAGAELSSKRPCGDAVGEGHVLVVFQEDGTVAKATLDGGPFVQTAVGECIERHFLGTRMRPFTGRQVRVGKSFRLP